MTSATGNAKRGPQGSLKQPRGGKVSCQRRHRSAAARLPRLTRARPLVQKRVKRDDSIWSEDTEERKETTHLLPGGRSLLPAALAVSAAAASLAARTQAASRAPSPCGSASSSSSRRWRRRRLLQ